MGELPQVSDKSTPILSGAEYFSRVSLELHEDYEKDLQNKTEELNSVRKRLESLLLEDLEEVSFFESEVKNRESFILLSHTPEYGLLDVEYTSGV